MSSTDVLMKAKCIPVDDRVYRVLPVRDSVKSIEDDVPYIHFDEDDDFDPDLPIIHQGNKFYITFHVPSSLIGIVVGARFKTLQALEQQYNVKINVPHRDEKETGITVSSSTKNAVSTAYHSIMRKITNARLRTESRHFISLPINSPEIQESFVKFKDEILTKYKRVRGIDESIFQKPAKLHVTVALLILLDETDKQSAIALLTKCRDNAIKDLGEKKIIAQVRGIEYMNDDPAEVDVLYAKLQELDDDNSLQIIADKIVNEFVDASLSKLQHERVKLHITLMNTLFRANLESKEDDDCERVTFDARPVIKDFLDYDFGQIVINEIHISVRYTEASNGYFSSIHKMKLNP